jgi:hypothetical protein
MVMVDPHTIDGRDTWNTNSLLPLVPVAAAAVTFLMDDPFLVMDGVAVLDRSMDEGVVVVENNRVGQTEDWSLSSSWWWTSLRLSSSTSLVVVTVSLFRNRQTPLPPRHH